MIYPIYIIGSSVLRQKAKEIDETYPDLQKLIEDMQETMYEADGIGLAAPQIGKSIRLMVIDASPLADDDPSLKDFKKVLINAEITEYSEDIETMSEGCLSIPGISEDVKRPDAIKIKYFDENFQLHEEHYSGFAARVIQHEFDHIEGVLFTDKVSPIRKRLIKSKLQAVSKGKFEHRYKFRLANKKRR